MGAAAEVDAGAGTLLGVVAEGAGAGERSWVVGVEGAGAEDEAASVASACLGGTPRSAHSSTPRPSEAT